MKERIKKLAQLFAKYKVYPKSCYGYYSPVRAFQRIFPENHYSKELETLLSCQDYDPVQRGADLPWWGKKLFSRKPDFRTLIVGQDSGYKDAGSVILATQFFPDATRENYQECTEEMKVEKYFSYNRWKKVRNQFVEWEIDFPFLYITDASKVYNEGSWEGRDFDRQRSKELLEGEIEFCNPDLIILLGAQPLYLLDKTINYASAVDSGKPISILNRKCVVAPFFLGNGPTQPNFRKRLQIATRLIKKLRNKKSRN